MADRKVRYILEVDYEGEGVTARAADDLREVDDAAKEATDGLEQVGGGFSKLQANLVTAQAALGLAQQGLETIGNVARVAYETLSEGAALADARGDFEDLAAGIGSTADALENELSTAAAGLVTDAELIGQAGELMALGLGLSKDEIVDLTGLAAELDWNFKTLTDTLNTGSTRGLKELGLSIDEVKGRMAELEEQGVATDQAFRMAIIEAGEAKLDRVGKKSEEASGQLQILENIVAGVQDEFARGAAEGFAEALGMVASSAPVVGAALESAARGTSSFIAEIVTAGALAAFADDLAWLIDKGVELQAEERRQADAIAVVTQGRADLAEMTAIYGDVLGDLLGEVEYSADVAEYGMAAWTGLVETYQIAAAQAAMAAEEGYYLAASLEAQAEKAGDLALQQQVGVAAMEAWAAYTAEMTAYGGDQFTMFSQSDEAWNFAEAVYAAADAAGAGAGPLADLGVSLGLIDDATADAATAAAQQQIIAENLAGAAATGQISWENYASAVEHAIEVLNGAALVELGPRDMPEMEDRGFREGFQEALAPVVADMEPIPLEVELERESIQAAVDEAKGIVEGFTNPADVYEAVINMDISSVESGAGKVMELMEAIPEVKDVRINVTAMGMEILEELRALGVIP